MFQNLLKTFNQNPNPHPNNETANAIATQSKDNPTIKDTNISRKRQANILPSKDTLFKKQTSNHFLDKLGQLGLQIDQLEQDSQKIAFQFNESNYQSEKASEIISINQIAGEQCHPMILSNIQNNIKSNIDKLTILRIRNSVSQLRQTYLELSDYVEDQKIITEYFNQRICLQFQDFVEQFKNKIKAQPDNQQIQSLKNSIRSLEASLQLKTQQTLQLNKQLSQSRHNLQKQLQKNRLLHAIRQQPTKSTIQMPCITCKRYQSKMQTIQLQLEQHQKQVEKLLVENENLQEYIFDMEQKVIGVDLEVERRLKESGKHQGFKIPPVISEQQNELIDQLQEQIAGLKERHRQFDNLQTKIYEINQRQSVLEERQRNLNKKETHYKDQLAKIQDEKEANYQREHQVLLAEENLSKKISDLRQKQTELSLWETDLAKKTKQTRNGHYKKDHTLVQQFPYYEPSIQHNSYQDLNRSDEISLKSFGKNKPSYERNNLKIKTSQEQLEHTNNYMKRHYEEQEEINNNRHYENYGQRLDYPGLSKQYKYYAKEQRQDRIPKRDSNKKIGDSAYIPRNRENVIDTKKYAMGLRGNLEASPYRNMKEGRHNRVNTNVNQHQFTLPHNSPSHFRDISKNSRSSASKSIRGGLNLHNSKAKPTSSSIPRDGQLIGLGSKLQRLRQQIKKQIQSIK